MSLGPGRVEPAAVAGVAALSDLEAADRHDLGAGAVSDFVGASPERYAELSPSRLLPIGVPLLIIHGEEDDVVPAGMSRTFAGLAADAGDEVVYHELETVGHDELGRPGSLAFERVADELDRLSQRVAAGE